MKILIVTDAWLPQAHGVVNSLVELVRELQAARHEVVVLHPGQFRRWRGPAWLGIDIALLPGRRLSRLVREAEPDAIHIATEGPLGWAARAHCRREGLPFTSSWWLRLPERLHQRLRVPPAWTQAWLRRFHGASQGVLVPGRQTLDRLLAQGLRQARGWSPGVDTGLFAPGAPALAAGLLGPLAHPVSLYVGQVSHDHRIEDFLRLDVPGSKLVCGAGPQVDALRQRYPNVHWLGHLPRRVLAQVYGAADVLVHPGRDEAPAAVVLEALACGTPVAGYPSDGMLQCFGQSPAAALRSDLREAWSEALRIPRHVAREHAQAFAWPRAARRFVAELRTLPRPSPARMPKAPVPLLVPSSQATKAIT